MRAVDIIRKKRDGQALTPAEIAAMVAGSRDGRSRRLPVGGPADGDRLARHERDRDRRPDRCDDPLGDESSTCRTFPGCKVDKHSTGGVGDKTSLILAPIAAAAGVPVPMVSGRGLGHTGGTLDKLESIPGFRVDLDLDRYQEVLAACGLVMIGQTAEIAPADKFLYALRDATATVESIPLIAASIMSKKLAEGIDGLVLDVKTGGGAFMERLDDSRALAAGDVRDRPGLGKQMVALITRMDQPLGCAVGNAVEVAESLECLQGRRPRRPREPVDRAGGRDGRDGRAGPTRSRKRGRSASRTIADGSALERFRRLVREPGGRPARRRRSARSCRRRAEDRVEGPTSRVSSSPWRRGRSATRPCCWARAGRGWTAPSITPSA